MMPHQRVSHYTFHKFIGLLALRGVIILKAPWPYPFEHFLWDRLLTTQDAFKFLLLPQFGGCGMLMSAQERHIPRWFRAPQPHRIHVWYIYLYLP